jgi:TonB family protein
MSERNRSTPSLLLGVSHWLIHRAAGRAPESLSQRLQEEWLADLAMRTSAISRLRFALGCCWATGIIAFEHRSSSLPVSNRAIEGEFMRVFAHHDPGYFSRRSGTLFLVASLHAILLYGIVTALSHTHAGSIPAPLQNKRLEDLHPKPLPPSIPQPQLDKPKIEAVIPEVQFPPDVDPRPEALTAEVVPELRPAPSLSSPPHVARQVQGGPGSGFPNPDDFYPSLARHMEEQGAATVRVCVDANGRLAADPTLLQGTGSTRLDDGALKLARAGSGHYRATTEDGRPISSCYPLRIRFQLKN